MVSKERRPSRKPSSSENIKTSRDELSCPTSREPCPTARRRIPLLNSCKQGRKFSDGTPLRAPLHGCPAERRTIPAAV